jgi:hypothetical protein
VYRGQNVHRKTYSVVVWEYGGGNGKTAKPRCFKNLTINNLPVILAINNLPVIWRNNEKKLGCLPLQWKSG